MQFRAGAIHDIAWRPLKTFRDPRGWLCELFRSDDLAAQFHPAMAYISETLPGVARGPHEHVEQADYFCFLGPGDFRLYLWDNRQHSPTYGCFQTLVVGQTQPMAVVIPPGVVHAYKNVSAGVGIVLNFPNRLYKGQGRQEPVDEIRHEDDPNTIFRLENAADAA